MLNPGDKAPDFTAQTQHGNTVSLSDFRGQKVVLYFYPKDDTPVCTKQACSLRDSHEDITSQGAVVLGVSPDGVASHEKFVGKFDLPFLLLCDEEKEIMTAYGVWGEKTLYGRTYIGVNRTTFLIDEEGTIFHKFPRPRTALHGAQVLKFLDV